MSYVTCTVRALAATALLVVACAGAWASDRDEHKGAAESSPRVDEKSPAGGLPFAVAGTMIAPPTKLAVISMIGGGGKAGAQMLAGEGAVVAEYRLVSILSDRVVFERDGHTFVVRVGTESPDALTPTPAPPVGRTRTTPLKVVAPPANIEEIRQQTGAFVDLLRANPEFQKALDERMRRVREMEAASQPPTRP